ncbi:galactose oxidase [Gigaspora margarita]|uniref:Galactose oxidase n=1 Tax=Gigaspora margarita TaxID=4874 RepID=A0A8H4AZL8_GIGMA|nr:galactose oxidase [Gigaspora margarita]
MNKDIEMPIGYAFGASCVSPIDNSVFLVVIVWVVVNNPVTHGFIFRAEGTGFKYEPTRAISNEIQPVIDNYGKFYTFGENNSTDLNASYVDYNDMSILDTTSMTWSTLAISTNAPPPLSLYTATLLPTGIIVYIGETKTRTDNTEEPVSMYVIQTFNTKNYNWSTKVAGGDNVGTRAYHTAVLTQNCDIIIYGGAMWNDSTIPATPYIAKLNTGSWMWSIPNLSQINSPQLSYHSAALYGDYMIIAFGQIPSKTSISFITLNNNLYILDIKSYTWVTSFNPNHSTSNQTFPPNNSTTNQTPSPDNNLNKYLFIGIGIVLLGLFSVVGFLLYKRK